MCIMLKIHIVGNRINNSSICQKHIKTWVNSVAMSNFLKVSK